MRLIESCPTDIIRLIIAVKLLYSWDIGETYYFYGYFVTVNQKIGLCFVRLYIIIFIIFYTFILKVLFILHTIWHPVIEGSVLSED